MNEKRNDNEEFYAPTTEESEAIDRAGLADAWRVLKQLEDETLPEREQVLICLRAFKATQAAVLDAEEELLIENPKARFVLHETDKMMIVCSALMGIDLEIEYIHPQSVMGSRVFALIQAVRSMGVFSSSIG